MGMRRPTCTQEPGTYLTASISPSHKGSSTFPPCFIYPPPHELPLSTSREQFMKPYIAAHIAVEIAQPGHGELKGARDFL